MPIYEFVCTHCGLEFEKIIGISAPHPECPRSEEKDHGPSHVQKKMSLTSFSLKGEGWYQHGYSKPSAKPSDKPAEKTSDKPASKPSESSPSKKTEGTGSGGGSAT